MATYNKFGRLIKIDGSGKWQNYLDARVAGNIVFANLTDDSSNVSAYPKGCYIYANGVEYKVADLAKFEQLKHDYEDFRNAVDTSINNIINPSVNELERWRKDLNFKLADNKITIVDGDKTGIKGEINFEGSEYVNINTSTDGSTMIFSLDEADIQYGSVSTAGSNQRYIATRGYVDDLESRVDVSLKTTNASVADLSTRILTRLTDARLTANQDSYNNVSVALYTTVEGPHGTTTETKQDNFTISGDDYVKAYATGDNVVKFELGVWNSSIDGKAYSDTSLAGVGVIKSYVDRRVQGLTGALRLMGGVKTAAELDAARTGAGGLDASKGCMWIANASFDYPATNPTYMIESGDQIVLTTDATSDTPAEFIVIERNLDGAVTAGKNLFTKGHLIMGDADDKQTVIDSGYTLGKDDDSSTTMLGNTSVLATEKAVETYVEAALTNLGITADTSSSYLNTSASYDRTTTKFNVTTGVNVTTFADTTASDTAGTTLADAATFKKAIDDVRGTLKVTTGESSTTGMLADASALIALQMSGGNTSIMINGGKYAIVNKGTDASILTFEVKASTLRNASTEFEGLAIASDVSAIINANELATAAAFAKVKEAAGLTDNLGAAWTGNMATAFGANTSIIKAVEGLDTSFVNASIHLNNRIDSLNLDNTDEKNRITVGIKQEKGYVTVTNASLVINGSLFQHEVGSGLVDVTLDGANISLGGADARWKAVKVDRAVIDLSTMIENVSTTFLKKVNGETPVTGVTGKSTVKDSFISVTATPTENNETYLDSSIVYADPVNLSTGLTSEIPTANGIADDKYVADYVMETLAWECY